MTAAVAATLEEKEDSVAAAAAAAAAVPSLVLVLIVFPGRLPFTICIYYFMFLVFMYVLQSNRYKDDSYDNIQDIVLTSYVFHLFY